MKPLRISRAAVKSLFTPYGGGLVRSRSPRNIKPNRILQCLNFEERYGEQGYSSIYGYERFDGHDAPSAAIYYVLAFTLGTAAIAVAATVTGAGATATVVSVTLSSGSWAGGDAAGSLILMLVTGNWVATEAIKVGGVSKAVATAAAELGSLAQGATNHQTYLTATRTALRTIIQKVPGSGSVLGVAVYRAAVYAARNVADGTSASIYKSSTTGWSAIATGLIPGGAWKFEVANFSGASTTLALFGVDGKNRLSKWDGTTFSRADPIYGSEGLSTSSVLIGTGAKTFVHSGTARSWVAGDALTVWGTADAANSMTGTVTSYTSGTSTLVLNVTSVTGAGTIASWEIGKTIFTDKPFLLTEHKDHLMLAYPLGQVQTSNLGSPMVATTTAAAFGFGSEITGLVSLKGALLAVFCRDKIEFVEGSSSVDWSKSKHAVGAGAVAGTIANNAGNALFLGDGGVTSLQAVQTFGDFAPSDLTRDYKDYLAERMDSVVGARLAGSANQYRLYFTDKNVMRLTLMSGTAEAGADSTSITLQQYLHTTTCFASGVMADNVEARFFGTDDGYVMQEDKGTSFDGTAIDYVLLTAFNHYKTPDSNKRFDELEFDLTSPDPLTVSFRQLFDYDDGVFAHGRTMTAATRGTGGQFDVSTWDSVLFDLPIHTKAALSIAGVGRSMALLIVINSGYVRSFTMHGINTKFSILGGQRP